LTQIPGAVAGRTLVAQFLLPSGALPENGGQLHQQKAFSSKEGLWKH
jgi:hypothetical protein